MPLDFSKGYYNDPANPVFNSVGDFDRLSNLFGPVAPDLTNSIQFRGRDTFGLSDVYAGRSVFLGNTIRASVAILKSWVTALLCPLEYTTEQHFHVRKLTFEDSPAELIAPNAPPTVSLYRREVEQHTLHRRAKGFNIDHELLGTPEGQEIYQMQFVQLAACFHFAIQDECIERMITCRDQDRVMIQKYFVTGVNVIDVFTRQRDNFALMQKPGDLNFSRLFDDVTQLMRRTANNTTPDIVIMPPYVKSHFALSSETMTDVSKRGPDANYRWEFGGDSIFKFRNSLILELVDSNYDGLNPIQQLERVVRIGDYFVAMDHLWDKNPEEYATHKRSIMVFNFAKDHLETITLRQLVQSCNRRGPDGRLDAQRHLAVAETFPSILKKMRRTRTRATLDDLDMYITRKTLVSHGPSSLKVVDVLGEVERYFLNDDWFEKAGLRIKRILTNLGISQSDIEKVIAIYEQHSGFTGLTAKDFYQSVYGARPIQGGHLWIGHNHEGATGPETENVAKNGNRPAFKLDVNGVLGRIDKNSVMATAAAMNADVAYANVLSRLTSHLKSLFPDNIFLNGMFGGHAFQAYGITPEDFFMYVLFRPKFSTLAVYAKVINASAIDLPVAKKADVEALAREFGFALPNLDALETLVNPQLGMTLYEALGQIAADGKTLAVPTTAGNVDSTEKAVKVIKFIHALHAASERKDMNWPQFVGMLKATDGLEKFLASRPDPTRVNPLPAVGAQNPEPHKVLIRMFHRDALLQYGYDKISQAHVIPASYHLINGKPTFRPLAGINNAADFQRALPSHAGRAGRSGYFPYADPEPSHDDEPVVLSQIPYADWLGSVGVEHPFGDHAFPPIAELGVEFGERIKRLYNAPMDALQRIGALMVAGTHPSAEFYERCDKYGMLWPEQYIGVRNNGQFRTACCIFTRQRIGTSYYGHVDVQIQDDSVQKTRFAHASMYCGVHIRDREAVVRIDDILVCAYVGGFGLSFATADTEANNHMDGANNSYDCFVMALPMCLNGEPLRGNSFGHLLDVTNNWHAEFVQRRQHNGFQITDGAWNPSMLYYEEMHAFSKLSVYSYDGGEWVVSFEDGGNRLCWRTMQKVWMEEKKSVCGIVRGQAHYGDWVYDGMVRKDLSGRPSRLQDPMQNPGFVALLVENY